MRERERETDRKVDRKRKGEIREKIGKLVRRKEKIYRKSGLGKAKG